MPSGRKPILLFAGLIVILAGWSVFWQVVARATQAGLDEWFAQELQAGRQWTCAKRSVSGYPFRIEVRCEKPTFTGHVGGVRAEGSVGDIFAAANAYQPNLIVAEVAPPLRLQTNPDNGSAVLDWSALRLSYRSSDGGLRLGSLVFEGAALVAQLSNARELRVAAALFELHVRAGQNQPNSFDLALTTKGLAAPIIDDLIGERSPLDMALSATLLKADALSRGQNTPPVERWRRAGGQLQIADFKLTKGEIDLAATGAIDIDEAHRARGTLDISAAGLQGTLQKLGIPSAVLAIGSLLGRASKDTKVTGDAPKPNALRFGVTLDNGRALVGPVRLPFAITPLY